MDRKSFFKKLAVLTIMAIPAGVVVLGQKINNDEPTLIASNLIKMVLPDGSEYYVVGVNKNKLEEIPYQSDKKPIVDTGIENMYFKKYKIKEYNI